MRESSTLLVHHRKNVLRCNVILRRRIPLGKYEILGRNVDVTELIPVRRCRRHRLVFPHYNEMLILCIRASVTIWVKLCVRLMGLLPCTGFYTESAAKGNKMQMSPLLLSFPSLHHHKSAPAPSQRKRSAPPPFKGTDQMASELLNVHQLFASPYPSHLHDSTLLLHSGVFF